MQDVDLLKKSKKDDLLENLTMRSKNHSKSELLPFDLLFDFQVNLGRFTAFVGELFSFSVFFFFFGFNGLRRTFCNSLPPDNT